MTPFASIIIPTYNRINYWKDNRLLDSLRKQSYKNFEVIIIDDNSTDDTAAYLKDILIADETLPRVTIVRDVVDKKQYHQASALPDNIGFSLATGHIVAHIDDDCWVHPNLIQTIQNNYDIYGMGAYWGNLIYVDEKFVEFRRDWRTKKYFDVYASNSEVLKIQYEWTIHWGALWTMPLFLIKQLGGHDMSIATFLGQDSRLGHKIKQCLPCYYSPQNAFSCWHRGKSWWWEREIKGEVEEMQKMSRTPSFGYIESTVVNEGREFWNSKKLKETYEYVLQKGK